MARVATAVAIVLMLGLASPEAGRRLQVMSPHSGGTVHHYEIDGAIRPLLLFWISRSNIGGATVTWRRSPDETAYSLLIGTDPARAPRNLNRWGYVDERLHGSDATILGLMTRSDEQSLEEAKASTKSADGEPQAFRVIRGSVSGGVARAAITTLGTPQHYTFRQLDEVLAHVPPTSAFDHERSTRLPPGAAPGFLTALDRVIEETLAEPGTGGGAAPASIQFVYYGKLYRLRATEAKRENELTLDGRDYQHLLDAKFEIHNLETGDDTDFEMTYGTEGALRGIPVTIQYQPRWWLRLKLRLTDSSSS